MLRGLGKPAKCHTQNWQNLVLTKISKIVFFCQSHTLITLLHESVNKFHKNDRNLV